MALYTMTFESSGASDSSPVTPPATGNRFRSDSSQPSADSSESEIPDFPPPIENIRNSITPHRANSRSPHRPGVPKKLPNRRDVVVRFSSSGSDDEIEHIETSYAHDPELPDEPPPVELPDPPTSSPVEEETEIPQVKPKDVFESLTFRGVADPSAVARLKAQIQRLPHSAPAADVIPYRILRTQKLTLKGLRTKFSLLRDGALILFSKIKARSSTEIVHVSREKKDFHFSSSFFEAALLAGNGFKSFSLRLRNQFGPELIIIRFEHPMLDDGPRVVRVMLFGQPEGVPSELVSRPPVVTTAGTWILDLRGRLGKRSIKNCVLTDRNDREFMSFMKLRKSEFAVESHPGISELCVFALGVSSCLCKL
jgi:hypothetical protein